MNQVSRVTAFVLGGGGVLGSAEVGMLQALLERGVTPDIILGSSIGAVNGAVVAADPSVAAVRRLVETWGELQARSVFSSSFLGQITNLVRHGTYLHSNEPLRRLIEDVVADRKIEDLAVRFQCVAASIERAGARWFDSGPVVDAVLASCAVPGSPSRSYTGRALRGRRTGRIRAGRPGRGTGCHPDLRPAGRSPRTNASTAEAAVGGRRCRLRDRPSPPVR